MLTAIIIDDEYNGIRSLELLIKRFATDVNVVAMTPDPYEGIELINNYRPDIVFLDINMPSLNGFEVLEKLVYNKFNLIFTTAHQEYAIRAIKQASTDYLLKPIDAEELVFAIEKVKTKISDNTTTSDVQNLLMKIVGLNNLRVPLPSKTSIDYVTPSMIAYVEANHNVSKVFLTNLTMYEVSKPLKDYELILCKEGLYFMRIHNSFVVNLNYVTQYIKKDGGYAVLQGKRTIPVSKQKKEEFLKFLNFNDED